jgi:gamma-glutamyltranspeptidase/glutathione hydrolase/leukotriene-C4 hydrolase
MILQDRTHPPEYYNPEFDVKIDHGTSHTSVVDKDGMAVALTTTVNLVFGSMVLDPETGIILNDEVGSHTFPTTSSN